MHLEDLRGRKFNMLTPLRYEGRSKWLCRCDCGKETIVAADKLKAGHTRSCGCLLTLICRKHGHGHDANGKQTRTYKAWVNMRSRVNPTRSYGRDYSSRGIVVCARWSGSFENFLADMGEAPRGMSLDRIDNSGNYEPQNCRWATPVQQSGNTRRNIYVLVENERMCVAQACARLGVLYDTVIQRIHRGIEPQAALDARSKRVYAKDWK
jgi:hypothetical protein